jgi:hypothetical protein
MNPSGVMTNPEPLPPISRGAARPTRRCATSMFTTLGETRSTAATTVREYSSSSKESFGRVGRMLLRSPGVDFVSPKINSTAMA